MTGGDDQVTGEMVLAESDGSTHAEDQTRRWVGEFEFHVYMFMQHNSYSCVMLYSSVYNIHLARCL